MAGVQLTAHELVLVLEQAGVALGWSRNYQSVIGTAIGFAFKTAGLDERTDVLSVTPEAVEQLAEHMVETSLASGQAAKTANSYASSWRRLATIAYQWKQAGGDQSDSTFWTDTDLGGKRPRRLGRQGPTSWGWTAPDDATPTAPDGRTIEIDLPTGPATVTLPDQVTDADLLEIVRALLDDTRTNPPTPH